MQKRSEFLPGPKVKIGMSWFRRQDYAPILQIMSDREALHDRYREWLASAERAEAVLVRQGRDVARVLIDPEAFLAWCRLAGVDSVAESRSAYVTELLGTGGATILPRRR